MEISKNLITYRKKNNLTQADVAIYLNISRQSVSKWETGQSIPSIDDLVKLSNLYNISVDSLINNIPVDNSLMVKKIKREEKEDEKKNNLFIIVAALSCMIIPLGGIVSLIILIANIKSKSSHYYWAVNLICLLCITVSVIYLLIYCLKVIETYLN